MEVDSVIQDGISAGDTLRQQLHGNNSNRVSISDRNNIQGVGKDNIVLDCQAEGLCCDIPLIILGNGASKTQGCVGGHVKICNSTGPN